MTDYAQMRRRVPVDHPLECTDCTQPISTSQALSEHRAFRGHHLCHGGITLVSDCWGCSDKQYGHITGREIAPGPVAWLEELIEHGQWLEGERPYALTRMESLLTTTEMCDRVKEYLESLRTLEYLKGLLADAKKRRARYQWLSRCGIGFAIASQFAVAAFQWFGPRHTVDWANLIVGSVLLGLYQSRWREYVERNRTAVTGDRG